MIIIQLQSNHNYEYSTHGVWRWDLKTTQTNYSKNLYILIESKVFTVINIIIMLTVFKFLNYLILYLSIFCRLQKYVLTFNFSRFLEIWDTKEKWIEILVARQISIRQPLAGKSSFENFCFSKNFNQARNASFNSTSNVGWMQRTKGGTSLIFWALTNHKLSLTEPRFRIKPLHFDLWVNFW